MSSKDDEWEMVPQAHPHIQPASAGLVSGPVTDQIVRPSGLTAPSRVEGSAQADLVPGPRPDQAATPSGSQSASAVSGVRTPIQGSVPVVVLGQPQPIDRDYNLGLTVADAANIINELELKLPSHVRDELAPQLNQIHSAITAQNADMHTLAENLPALVVVQQQVLSHLQSQSKIERDNYIYTANNLQMILSTIPTIEQVDSAIKGISALRSSNAELDSKIDAVASDLRQIAQNVLNNRIDTKDALQQIDHVYAAINKYPITHSILEDLTHEIEYIKMRVSLLPTNANMAKFGLQLTSIKEALDAASSIPHQGDATTAQHVEQQLAQFVNQLPEIIRHEFQTVLQSTSTKSMIANSVSSGLGSFGSGVLVKSFFESLKLPITAAVDLTEIISNVSSAAQSISSAAESVTNAAQSVQQTIKDIPDPRPAIAALSTAISSNASRPQRLPEDVIIRVPSDRSNAIVDPMLRKKRKVNADGRLIGSFGDHTVTVVGVTNTTLAQTPRTTNTSWSGSWFEEYLANAVHYDAHFSNVNGVLGVAAEIGRINEQGRVRQFFPQVTVAYHTMQNAVMPAYPTVGWADTVIMSHYETAVLSRMRTDQNVNERTVVSTYNGYLHPADPTFLKNIAFKIDSDMNIYDNTGLYTKMMYWLHVREHFRLMGLEPAAQPAVNVDIHWVNLALAEIAWQTLANDMTDGRFIMIENIDFQNNNNSWVMLNWLSSTGHRYAVDADGVQGPSSRYFDFPAIPITILAHGAQPNAPAMIDFHESMIIGFVQRLAYARREQDQLIRGMYAAACLASQDFPVQPAAPAAIRRNFNFMLTAQRTFLMARPRDSNWMLRLIDVQPVLSAQNAALVDRLFSITAQQRLTAATTMVAALTSSFTATYASFTVCRASLALWTGGLQLNSQLEDSLFRQLNALPQAGPMSSDRDSDGMAFAIAKNAFTILLGVQFPKSLFRRTSWAGNFGAFPSAVPAENLEALQIFGQFPGQATHPVRKTTLLGLMAIVREIPAEWGISLPGQTMDLRQEIIRHGPAATLGWYSNMGDATYMQRINSSSPYMYIPYAFQVVQAFAQYENLDAAHPLAITPVACNWAPGLRGSTWQAPAAIAEFAPDAVAGAPNLFMYEPCSAISFSWPNSQVCSIALLFEGQLQNQRLRQHINTPLTSRMGISTYDNHDQYRDWDTLNSGFEAIPAFEDAAFGSTSAPVASSVADPT